MTNPRKPRMVLAAVLTTSLVAAFAALGGVSVAQSAISAFQYQYGHKVTICHKGKTITVAKASLPAHVKHGDTVGTCAAAAKANKAKEAKLKAAKAKAEAKARAEKAKAKKAETESPGKGKGRGKGK